MALQPSSTFRLPQFRPPNCSVPRGQLPVATRKKSRSSLFYTFLTFTTVAPHCSVASELGFLGFFGCTVERQSLYMWTYQILNKTEITRRTFNRLSIIPITSLVSKDSSINRFYDMPYTALRHLRRSFHYAINPLRNSGYFMYHQAVPSWHSQMPRSAHTVYLCVLCGSQNKQRLFPYTALIDWFL
jgi:hypothetical protein